LRDVPLLDLLPPLFLQVCAPQIAPTTLAAIVQQESGGHWLAIHDNTTGESYRPETLEEAVLLARSRIEARHSVDTGATQINSANLAKLGLGIESAFDPCMNLRAAQSLLLEDWRRSGGDLRATLALYHTGCGRDCPGVQRHLGATYSSSVYAQAGVTVPAIPTGQLAQWAQEPPVAAAPRSKATATASPERSALTPHSGDLLATGSR